MANVRPYLSQLEERTVRAINLYYGLETGEPLTYKEVGLRLSPTISSERVRQIIHRGIRKIQYHMGVSDRPYSYNFKVSELVPFLDRG